MSAASSSRNSEENKGGSGSINMTIISKSGNSTLTYKLDTDADADAEPDAEPEAEAESNADVEVEVDQLDQKLLKSFENFIKFVIIKAKEVKFSDKERNLGKWKNLNIDKFITPSNQTLIRQKLLEIANNDKARACVFNITKDNLWNIEIEEMTILVLMIAFKYWLEDELKTDLLTKQLTLPQLLFGLRKQAELTYPYPRPYHFYNSSSYSKQHAQSVFTQMQNLKEALKDKVYSLSSPEDFSFYDDAQKFRVALRGKNSPKSPLTPFDICVFCYLYTYLDTFYVESNPCDMVDTLRSKGHSELKANLSFYFRTRFLLQFKRNKTIQEKKELVEKSSTEITQVIREDSLVFLKRINLSETLQDDDITKAQKTEKLLQMFLKAIID